MNKKGNSLYSILILIGGLIALALLAVTLTIGWGITKTATDEIFPVLEDLGEIVPGYNNSETMDIALTPIESMIDNFSLMIGLIYVVGIIGMLSFAFIFRNNYNGWVVALFIVSIMVLIVTCIGVSQMYEDFYLEQDELGEALRSATLISYLIIYSPVVMTLVAFIAGIILFTGNQEVRYNV